MKTNFMNRLLMAGLIAFVAFAVRADEEQDLIAILQSNAGIPQKCAACQKLRVVGTAKSVPALAALLAEERTGHAARYALEGMPYPEAGAALRQAIEKTSGLIKAGLVDSAGWRRDAAAVPLLVPLLSSDDAVLTASAATALGRIGGKESIAALLAVRESVPPAVKPAVLNALLLGAEQLLASGDATGATAIYREVSDAKSPAQIRTAAWRGLVLADDKARAGLVTKALLGQDKVLRPVALKTLRELNDPQVIKACLGEWPSLAADAQLAVLDASLKPGADGRPSLRLASESQHPAVRAAAWQAMGDLGDLASVSSLAKAAAGGDAAERAAARESLARLRGAGIHDALLKEISTAEPAAKAELLRALGDRGDTAAASVLVQHATSGSEPVQLAALESLRKLAVPDTLIPLLEITAKTTSDVQRDPALRALYAACQASADKEQVTRQVIKAMGGYPAPHLRQALPVLAELGTPGALEAALAATRNAYPELVKEAVRVLAQWPTAAPAPRLLELARTSDQAAVQVLALRGCIEVISREPDSTKRLALLQQARGAAKRPDEKRQALGQMGQIPTAEALQVVLVDLADPNLSDEAGLAAVSIAEKLTATNPKIAAEVAAKVLAQCKSEDVVKRAWALRGKPKAGGPFIQSWLASGPYSQAGANDALAVFKVAFAPEKPSATVEWKTVPRADMINLLGIFPDKAGGAAYLKTKIFAPEECEAALLMGSDDGLKAWLNGVVVHSNNVDRGAVVDQDMAPIKLNKGVNELMLKVTQGGGGWAVCARIVGTDGLPIAKLTVQAER